MEIGEIYQGTRPRVAALVGGLSAAEAATPVPGTPLWTVKDVTAHLTGLVDDVLNGVVEGAGSPSWTAAQVEARKNRSVDEVLAEWGEKAPAFEALFDGGPPMLAMTGFDVLVHEHDIRGALGMAGPSDDEMVDTVVQRAMDRLGSRIDSAGAPPLRVCAGATEWVVGSGGAGPGATVTTDEFELFRALFGRRSEVQVLRWDWTGDAQPYLGSISVFGAMPAADVQEAGAS